MVPDETQMKAIQKKSKQETDFENKTGSKRKLKQNNEEEVLRKHKCSTTLDWDPNKVGIQIWIDWNEVRQNPIKLSWLMCSKYWFYKIIAYVFPYWQCVNMHLNAPDSQENWLVFVCLFVCLRMYLRNQKAYNDRSFLLYF